MRTSCDFVILIGPPGSGKTHLGRLLSRELGLAYSDLEAALLEKYGDGASFSARKHEALAFIEAALRAMRRPGGPAVVVESTGLSDRPMLERLQTEFSCLLVRVRASADLCVDRVRGRPAGQNLENTPERVREFHAVWSREISPAYRFDLELDTEDRSEAELLTQVRELLGSREAL